MPSAASRITPAQFAEVLRLGMPAAAAMSVQVTTLEHGLAVLRFTARPDDLRPGGSVAGPVLFALGDLAMYAAVMSVAGVVPLAVTTDATIHFLRRPQAGELEARARVLKNGKRLVIGDVHIAHVADDEAPVAHLVMTYSKPDRSEAEGETRPDA